MTDSEPAFSAKWIGPPGDALANCTFLARQQFTVDVVIPDRVILRIAADSRYVAFLNGDCLGAGPVRGTDERFFFDSYEIAPLLAAGANWLALQVHCPITPVTSAVPPVAPAVWAQVSRCESPGCEGSPVAERCDQLIRTDATWQIKHDPSYRTDTLFYTHHIGYSVYCDLRNEPAGWQTGADGHDGWASAVELADAHGHGGRRLCPRDIPALTADRYPPASVVDCGGVPSHDEETEESVAFADLMQMEMHLHTAIPRILDPNVITHNSPVQIVPANPLTPLARGEGAYLILDFERAVCGGLELDVEGPAGTIVDIAYDETVLDRRVNPRAVNPNGSVYRFADRYVLREGRQQISGRLHDRGFRLAQLVFRRFPGTVTIHGVAAEDRVYPVPLEGRFECDDPYLNRLWEKSVATIRACSMDLFVDCPWREQTLWLDDYFQENLFYFTITADARFPARNLRVSADGVLSTGQFPGRYPSSRELLLPVTSANWVMVLSDYYHRTGDLELVTELIPYVDGVIGLYESWQDPDSLVADRSDMWNLIDWGYEISGVQLGGKTAPLNMTIAATCKLASNLHAALGHADRATQLSARAREIVAALEQTLWDDDARRFRDCTAPGDGRQTASQIPHALAVYYDLLDHDKREAALDVLTATDVVEAEYSYQLFVLEALARCGRPDHALSIIRERWRNMVESDSPTLWEVEDGKSAMTGCGSLCHGFSCAPLVFMQAVILGVRPMQPGFVEFAVAPQQLGLQHAKGAVPTPHGLIHMEWTARASGAPRPVGHNDGELDIRLTVPADTTAVLPDGRRLSPGTHAVVLQPG